MKRCRHPPPRSPRSRTRRSPRSAPDLRVNASVDSRASDTHDPPQLVAFGIGEGETSTVVSRMCSWNSGTPKVRVRGADGQLVSRAGRCEEAHYQVGGGIKLSRVRAGTTLVICDATAVAVCSAFPSPGVPRGHPAPSPSPPRSPWTGRRDTGGDSSPASGSDQSRFCRSRQLVRRNAAPAKAAGRWRTSAWGYRSTRSSDTHYLHPGWSSHRRPAHLFVA